MKLIYRTKNMKGWRYVLFSGLILMTMCRKKEVPEQIERRPFSIDFKTSWFFKPGSYWIVKDSVKNITDSIYVTAVSSATRTGFVGNKKFNGEEISIFFNKDHLFPSLVLSTLPQEHIKVPFSSLGYYTVFDTDTANLKTPPADGIYSNKMITNFSSGGIIHSSVREINFKYSFYPPSHPEVRIMGLVYFRKDVGIVRRVKIPNIPSMREVYEVIRYHIVK